MQFGDPVPILRIFDETKAKEFYCGFLGFSVDWEHRFESDAPLYMQVSHHGKCCLHLSEHYGDSSPGSTVRIDVSDIDVYNAELLAKRYKFARPGIDETPYGTREMRIDDPFGNRIIFSQDRDNGS